MSFVMSTKDMYFCKENVISLTQFRNICSSSLQPENNEENVAKDDSKRCNYNTVLMFV